MRNYKHDGLVLPSVTTILADTSNSSAPLMQWAANCCADAMIEELEQPLCLRDIDEYVGENDFKDYDDFINQAKDAGRFAYKKVSKQALEVGSAVHSSIEAYLTIGGKPTPPKTFSVDMRGEFQNAFNAFLKFENTVNPVPVALEKTVYGGSWAGTLDMICKLNGKIYVIDFKTSKAIYPNEYGAQIAAYRSCVPEAEGCGILRLDKVTGLPEWKDFSNRYEKDLKRFEAMVVLYMLNHPRIAKKAGFNADY